MEIQCTQEYLVHSSNSIISFFQVNYSTNKMASAVTENLDKHFCCSVCLEKFNNPRVLSCLHTFCERCLEKLVECDDRPVFYCIIGQCGQPVEKRWMVRCPECRQITEVGRV